MFDIKEALGASPVEQADGTYTPSKASTKVAVPRKSGYKPVDYTGTERAEGKRVLVLCTDQGDVTCKNGKVFKSGNHPVEMMIPLLHLERAGFSVDFATPSGNPVPIEEWAMPEDGDPVPEAIKAHQEQLDHPLTMDAVAGDLDATSPYVAVYIPGGHGALLSVPDSTGARDILRWVLENDRHLITICHGPAGLLSLTIDTERGNFPLSGYSLVCFAHEGDELMEKVGYLPGPVPYFFDEELSGLGMDIRTTLPTGKTHVDRKLISGDSPMAADKLGHLAATELLASLGA